MIAGARRLPTMHVSVRVPWHDSRWAGKICANPRGNTSCLILPRVAETKDDDFETSVAGANWDTEGVRLPACAAERGAFMAPFGYLNETVQRWKRIVGAEPGRFVQVMDLGYRWGSCSADGTLNFHWRVMQLPPRIIEYVVVHELVHIKVPNHSEKFWKMLGSVMPDYESRKAWLKQKGGEL
ncbi:M48 family metallopeptidase [Rhodovulum sp. YEN HP10]|uniref:M48 metallopeptidase family protein n=1 Tax=Rhodovulum sp. HP10 TaxID=3387397 RepID=UPI0039DF3A4C